MMTRLVCCIFLLLAMVSCAAGFIAATAKVENYKARSELVRCQEGYTAACKRWQQIASNYQN